ncbi:MAG: hypothetical protein K2W99_02815 [Chthoniobacterales bacterium]|nr:hypothetical protein [Chthoniobacterales bacterium]
MKKLFCCFFFLYIISLQAGPLPQASFEKEYIVVTGGPSLIEWEKFKTAPHDHWWANFVHASRIRLEELRTKLGPAAKVTWMVYKKGYERRAQRQEKRDLIANLESVRDKYKVKLVYFNSEKEFLHYLNHGQPRDRVKIADLEYFGHSNRACFLFDYSNFIDTGSKVWLHEKELSQIDPTIFAPHAFIKSWGCHTGESMSTKWKKALGCPMIGAVGSTNYANSDAPGWHPSLAPHGRWRW